MHNIRNWTQGKLAQIVLDFQEVGSLALPRTADLPQFPSIDYYGTVDPYRGCVGGDHLAFVNFEKHRVAEKIEEARESGREELVRALERTRRSFGVLVADVAGHSVADNLTVNYLHGAFTTGVEYELEAHGEVTAGLFEKLNANFYDRSRPSYLRSKPFATLIYGEVHKNGRFRYISAGHPAPIVFSHEQERIVQLSSDVTQRSTPLGVVPSAYQVHEAGFSSLGVKRRYPVNEITLLGQGDVLLLATDGLLERERCEEEEMAYFEHSELERVLVSAKDGTARDIHDAIKAEAESICPASDDVTLVVVKKR